MEELRLWHDDKNHLSFDKMKELDLKHRGVVLGMCPVAPYMGREIKPDRFVSRMVIPVEE